MRHGPYHDARSSQSPHGPLSRRPTINHATGHQLVGSCLAASIGFAVAIAFLFAIGIAAFGELFARNLLRNRLQTFLTEFPVSTEDELHRFVNHHPLLGWEPRPTDEETPDTGHSKPQRQILAKSSYRINRDGSRYCPPPNRSLGRTRIEFFGDSATFCRDVADNETYQYFLENDHGVGPTKNFGVGNYGIDQAFLRARDRMEGGGIAVMEVTLSSIYRIVTVYKHYCEIGNHWAVKPRFLLDKQFGSLELLERPILKREELAELEIHQSFFREYDWFADDFLRFVGKPGWSHLKYLLGHDHMLAMAAKRIPMRTLRGGINRGLSHLGKKPYRPHNDPIRLLEIASGEGGAIAARILKAFTSLAEQRGALPIIVLSPQGHLLHDEGVCGEISRKLRDHFSDVGLDDALDFGDVLLGASESERTRWRAYSTHLSPEGNRVKAEWLSDPIQSLVS